MMTNKGVKSITLTFGDGPSITHEVHDLRGQYCLPRDVIEDHDYTKAQDEYGEKFTLIGRLLNSLRLRLSYYEIAAKPKLAKRALRRLNRK